MKTNILVILAVGASIILCLSILVIFFGIRNIRKAYIQIAELLNNVDRNKALTQLSELKGRILEVKSLCPVHALEATLWDELDNIITPNYFTNPYLEDFHLNVPSSFNLEEVCEALISQIDDKLNTIVYATKGE